MVVCISAVWPPSSVFFVSLHPSSSTDPNNTSAAVVLPSSCLQRSEGEGEDRLQRITILDWGFRTQSICYACVCPCHVCASMFGTPI